MERLKSFNKSVPRTLGSRILAGLGETTVSNTCNRICGTGQLVHVVAMQDRPHKTGKIMDYLSVLHRYATFNHERVSMFCRIG